MANSTIYRRKDGRWAADIALGYENGKRYRKTIYGATRQEVSEKLGDATLALSLVALQALQEWCSAMLQAQAKRLESPTEVRRG